MKKINVDIESLINDHKNKITMDNLMIKYGYCKQVLRRLLVENNAFIEPYRKIIQFVFNNYGIDLTQTKNMYKYVKAYVHEKFKEKV